MIVPAMIPSSVASGATLSVSEAPASTREKTSRPSWSVPNQCAELGPRSTASLCSSGSSGVSAEPVMRPEHPEQDDDAAEDEGLRADELTQHLAPRDPRLGGDEPESRLDSGRIVDHAAHSAPPKRIRGLNTE